MEFRQIKTDYLEMVSGGDKGVISELVEIFRSQVTEFYNIMVSCYSSGNFSELKLIAHKAKSSVAIVGMERLATRLKEMEEMIIVGSPLESESIIEEFRRDTAIAVNELDQYLASL